MRHGNAVAYAGVLSRFTSLQTEENLLLVNTLAELRELLGEIGEELVFAFHLLLNANKIGLNIIIEGNERDRLLLNSWSNARRLEQKR